MLRVLPALTGVRVADSLSEKHRVVTVLLKLANFAFRNNRKGIFLVDGARYMSQSTQRASVCCCPSQAATSMHAKRHGKKFFFCSRLGDSYFRRTVRNSDRHSGLVRFHGRPVPASANSTSPWSVTRLTLPGDNLCASIGTLRRADQGFVLFSFAPHSGTQVGPRSPSYQQFARRWPAPVLFSGGPPPGDPVGHISVEDCK
jgi:hypothetical protein